MHRSSFMRISLAAISAPLFAGCAIQVVPPVAAVDVAQTDVAVEASGPVIEGPGVVAIDVEPDPADRVYVYDVGFPPGTYLYNGFYWYGGYRYDHDVFLNSYVAVNVREHRFADVSENRRVGNGIEARHAADFKRTGGKRVAATAGVHAQARVDAGPAPAAASHPAAARPQPARSGGKKK
jgi:hypothetical protein